jgi:hypothetical protein
MTRTLFGIVAVTLLAGACASSGAARGPAPLDPVGTYDFAAVVDGQTVPGTIRISAAESGYGGIVTTGVYGETRISQIEVVGNRMRIIVGSPEGDAVLELDMDGQSFTGTWALGGMSGALSGTKRS